MQAGGESNFLPAKVPSRVVIVEAIPKGSTGKLQRIGLAENLGVVEDAPAPSRAAFAPPATSMEASLAQAWQQVLQIERVGSDDHFFQLGGDSIQAARVATHGQYMMKIDLPMVAVLETPTLHEMAAFLEKQEIVASHQAYVAELLAEIGSLREEHGRAPLAQGNR